jgi:hypothetical protein
MISHDRSLHIEQQLAHLIGVAPDELRDYIRSYIDVRRVDQRRVTGIRLIRGTHGGTYVRDPNGTDPLPAASEYPPE